MPRPGCLPVLAPSTQQRRVESTSKEVISMAMRWNKIYCKQNTCPMPRCAGQRKTNLIDYIPATGSPGLSADKKWDSGSGGFIAWDSSSFDFTPQQPLGSPPRHVLPVASDADADSSDFPKQDCAEEHVVSARDPADAVAAVTDSSEEEMPVCGPAREVAPIEPSASPATIIESQAQGAYMANETSIPADSSVCTPYPSFSEKTPLREDKELDEITKSNRHVQGLLYFKKWWFLRRIDVSVKGTLLTGTPIFIRKNAIRVVNEAYSYIIPLHNVDYFRTPDGLDFIESEFEGNVIGEQSV